MTLVKTLSDPLRIALIAKNGEECIVRLEYDKTEQLLSVYHENGDTTDLLWSVRIFVGDLYEFNSYKSYRFSLCGSNFEVVRYLEKLVNGLCPDEINEVVILNDDVNIRVILHPEEGFLTMA